MYSKLQLLLLHCSSKLHLLSKHQLPLLHFSSKLHLLHKPQLLSCHFFTSRASFICSASPSCPFFTARASPNCSTSPSCSFFTARASLSPSCSFSKRHLLSKPQLLLLHCSRQGRERPQLAEVLHLAASRGCLSSGVSAEVTNSPSDSTQHFMHSMLLLVWLCGGGGCRGLDWEASLKELWRGLCSQPDLGTLASSKQKAIVPRLIVFISSQYHAAQGDLQRSATRPAHVSMLQSQHQERLSWTPSTAKSSDGGAHCACGPAMVHMCSGAWCSACVC